LPPFSKTYFSRPHSLTMVYPEFLHHKAKTNQEMTKETAIKLFEQHKVRTLWDEDIEKWFFSIIDVVAILAENDRPRKYWSDLKR